MNRYRRRLVDPSPGDVLRLALSICLGISCLGSTLGREAMASTVVLRLVSPQDGAVLAPGETIEWSIEARASSGDNAGLALIVADLVQSDDNPAKLDLPPADGVPAAMAAFTRPLGVSNPGEGGLTTGYVGLQRGSPGARSLVQIGGSQNTTGVVGTLQGQSTRVMPGVAQDSAVLVARGSFAAPAVAGAYSYILANAISNTLVEVQEAPAVSRVEMAKVVLELESFTFTVEGGPPRCANGCFIRGDCNGDGRATGSVTDAVFLLSFLFLGGAEPPCLAACDVNGDGRVAGSVTDAVVLLQFNFLGGLPPPPPFPDCAESTRASDADLGCLKSQEVCQ